MRWKQDIPCVQSKSFRVFEAKHFLCSKQDIPCVRSRTFLVFEAGHSLCSNHDIPCVPSRTFRVFEGWHSLCSKQDIPCVARTGHLLGSNHEKCTCHFSANSADRPGICANYDMEPPNPGTIGWIRQKSGVWFSKTSNGSKIARIAPILTIFGRNRSRRPKHFFPKFSRRRKNFRVDGKFPRRQKIFARRRRKVFARIFLQQLFGVAVIPWSPRSHGHLSNDVTSHLESKSHM